MSDDISSEAINIHASTWYISMEVTAIHLLTSNGLGSRARKTIAPLVSISAMCVDVAMSMPDGISL
jgi:hypothetical protein